MRKALVSFVPLVAGIAIAAWPADPLDYCQLKLTFHDNGKVARRGYIAVNDETAAIYKTGVWTSWHINGQKKSEGSYRHGKKEGAWTNWGDKGDKVSSRAIGAVGKYTLDKAALEEVLTPENPTAGSAKMVKQMLAGTSGSLELMADGTCSISMAMMSPKKDTNGTWKLDGDKLSITTKEGGTEDTRVLNFANGVITMKGGGGDNSMLKFNKAAK